MDTLIDVVTVDVVDDERLPVEEGPTPVKVFKESMRRTLTGGQREAITYLFSVIFKWKLSISSTVTLLLCST